jgi:hypothetical protein
VLDGRTVLLRAGALTRVRLERDDNLMNQRFVVLAAEQGFWRSRRAVRLSLGVQYFQFHRAPLCLCTGLAGRLGLDRRANDDAAA